MHRPSGLPSGSDAGCTADEQQLHLNLCLLGVHAGSAKYGVELTRQCFRKPYPKGLEVVLYQLHSSIAGELKTVKEFKALWPVNDKNQSKEFNQKITDWFKDLKEKYHLDTVGIMTASQLRSATGHRVVSTLLELSTLALNLEYQRLDPVGSKAWQLRFPAEKDNRLMAELPSGVLASLAGVGVLQESQRFISLSKQAADQQRQCERFARELQEQYYALRSTHQQLQQKLDPSTMSVFQSLDTSAVQPTQLSANPASWLGFCLENQSLGYPNAHPSCPTVQAGLLPQAPCLEPPATAACKALESLDTHLQQYGQLQQLAGSAVGAALHPNAINGAALARLRSDPSSSVATASSGAAAWARAPEALVQQTVDIPTLLSDWVSGLEAAVPHVAALAGRPSNSQAVASLTPGVAPLMGPASDASSHAALLATQLRIHDSGVRDLANLRSTLTSQLTLLDTQLRELQQRVASAASQPIQHHPHSCRPSRDQPWTVKQPVSMRGQPNGAHSRATTPVRSSAPNWASCLPPSMLPSPMSQLGPLSPMVLHQPTTSANLVSAKSPSLVSQSLTATQQQTVKAWGSTALAAELTGQAKLLATPAARASGQGHSHVVPPSVCGSPVTLASAHQPAAMPGWYSSGAQASKGSTNQEASLPAVIQGAPSACVTSHGPDTSDPGPELPCSSSPEAVPQGSHATAGCRGPGSGDSNCQGAGMIPVSPLLQSLASLSEALDQEQAQEEQAQWMRSLHFQAHVPAAGPAGQQQSGQALGQSEQGLQTRASSQQQQQQSDSASQPVKDIAARLSSRMLLVPNPAVQLPGTQLQSAGQPPLAGTVVPSHHASPSPIPTMGAAEGTAQRKPLHLRMGRPSLLQPQQQAHLLLELQEAQRRRASKQAAAVASTPAETIPAASAAGHQGEQQPLARNGVPVLSIPSQDLQQAGSTECKGGEQPGWRREGQGTWQEGHHVSCGQAHMPVQKVAPLASLLGLQSPVTSNPASEWGDDLLTLTDQLDSMPMLVD
ncbi:HAUS augmin-like complex subunit 6 N-terminus-domain-containing protein [Haematococcus lacustris]